MSEWNRRVIIVVPAADRDRANGVAQTMQPVGGERTFTVGLSATGLEPWTHYWCSVALREAEWQAAQAQLAAFPGAGLLPWDMDGDPGLPDRELAARALRRPARQDTGA